MKFEDLKLSRELFEAIMALGHKSPTQIQEKSIPPILEGKDVLGESATGSGKTLAFGCGVFDKVVPRQGLQALILAPTRELAEQVKDSLKKISYKKRLNIIAVYGGVSMNPQIDNLRTADVVVATPGRLLDHWQRNTLNLTKIKLLVLDEADRMLDMGFIEDVEQIIRACPKQRQTLFFSATISSEIKRLSSHYTHNPVYVGASNQVDPRKLTQVYYDVPKGLKLSLLVHLLKEEKAELVMVFCNTRKSVDFIVKNLQKNKVDAIAIHGGLSQNKRTKTINLFGGGKVGVLVCTDVASRGLHIENISHVYNYEIPKDSKDYVHRIGRTARAGKDGMVINLLSDQDYDNFSRVNRDYRFNIKNIKKPHVEKVEFIKNIERDKRRFHKKHNHQHYRR